MPPASAPSHSPRQKAGAEAAPPRKRLRQVQALSARVIAAAQERLVEGIFAGFYGLQLQVRKEGGEESKGGGLLSRALVTSFLPAYI